MKFLFRVVGYPLVFTGGIFAFWFFQWTLAGIPRSGQPLFRPKTIELMTIVPEHKWILNYEVSVCRLDVDSKREYVLLLLTPLDEQNLPSQTNDYQSWLEITGLPDPEASLWFGLKQSEVRQTPNAQYIKLLEFTGNIFNSKRIKLLDSLELKSQELDSSERSKSQKFKFEGKKWHQM